MSDKINSFPSKWLRYQFLFVALAVIVFEFAIVMVNQEPASYWLTYWWMFPVAFGIALMANTVGISGAALFVPFFILIFPFITEVSLPAIDAVRLGLITESFGLGSSALAFLAFGLADIRLAIRAKLSALLFVVGGAAFASFLPQTVLYVVIAILLITAVSLFLFREEFQKKRAHESEQQTVSYSSDDPLAKQSELVSKDGKRYAYHLTPSGNMRRFFGYSIGGFFQGAAGFGLGELGVISMILTKVPIRVAIGTSHIIIAVTAILALLLHFLFAAGLPTTHNFLWNIPAMTVPAVAVGGQLAPHITSKLSAKLLEHFISALLLVVALALVVLAINA